MSRGRGGSYSTRGGGSYRGSSRGNSSWGNHSSRGGYSPRPPNGGGRFPSSSPFDSRTKYPIDRFSGSSRPHSDDYRKSTYKQEYGRSNSGHRSPERKRMRTEYVVQASSSRHDSSYGSGYGGSSRYESSYSDRRSVTSNNNDRHSGATRRDEFRRPSGPPPSSRGGGYSSARGRLSTRGSRGLKLRDRPTRRRLIESSYAVRKRVLPPRASDYARKIKISRMRSDIAARRAKKRQVSSKTESEPEKKEEKEKPAEIKKDEVKEETNEPAVPKKEEKKEPTEKEEKKDTTDSSKKFVKLNCPHCLVKSVTHRKYEMHLTSKTHLMAMRKIALKQKSILSQMRQAQRSQQNELEKSSDDLTARTSFCPLCKLNYKQRKGIHQRSDAHKNMKKFLMPFCKICKITFKSPMMYETHCSTIEHLLRKQRVENGNTEAPLEDDNLENFTTIDSVGDIDDADDKKENASEEPVNVGIEQIRKVEAHYCDLCKMYLPRGDEAEMGKILARHCKLRIHMQRYVRYKEDQDLEKRAEKLQRKETAEKEIKNKEKNDAPADETKSTAKHNDIVKLEDEEEKNSTDADKDIEDILAEAETGNKTSDDEEEEEHMNGERYDRFKLSEKNDEESLTNDNQTDDVENSKENKSEDAAKAE